MSSGDIDNNIAAISAENNVAGNLKPVSTVDVPEIKHVPLDLAKSESSRLPHGKTTVQTLILEQFEYKRVKYNYVRDKTYVVDHKFTSYTLWITHKDWGYFKTGASTADAHTLGASAVTDLKREFQNLSLPERFSFFLECGRV